MTKEKSTPAERVIAFRPEIAREVGVVGAILYQQLFYWSDKGGREDGFIYKSRKEIEEETALTAQEQRTALARLKKLGWLETKLYPANGKPTLHYRCLKIVKTTTDVVKSTKEVVKSTTPFVGSNKLITETTSKDYTKDLPTVRGKPEINEIISHYEGTFGHPLTGVTRQRRAAQTLLARCKSLDSAKRSIDVAHEASLDRYSGIKPSELAWLQSTRNWNKLVSYAQNKPKQRGKQVVGRVSK